MAWKQSLCPLLTSTPTKKRHPAAIWSPELPPLMFTGCLAQGEKLPLANSTGTLERAAFFILSHSLGWVGGWWPSLLS